MSLTLNEGFSGQWRKQFLEYAERAGLLDLSKRPKARYCPNGHQLPDERGEKYGQPVWVQIQECPICQQQAQRAQMMDRLIERLTKAGVPEMFQCWTTGVVSQNRSDRECLLVDEDNYQARVACTRYPDKNTWIVFAGTVGVGKTTWASALFCDLVDRNESTVGASRDGGRYKSLKGMWMSEADMFMKCDQEHHEKGYNARTNYLSKVCRSPLLMLDDLGGSRRALTEWQGGAMRHLFDYRHKYGLPTLMTTNLADWNILEKRYGDHVVSRMIDRCRSMTMLTGEDRRL